MFFYSKLIMATFVFGKKELVKYKLYPSIRVYQILKKLWLIHLIIILIYMEMNDYLFFGHIIGKSYIIWCDRETRWLVLNLTCPSTRRVKPKPLPGTTRRGRAGHTGHAFSTTLNDEWNLFPLSLRDFFFSPVSLFFFSYSLDSSFYFDM